VAVGAADDDAWELEAYAFHGDGGGPRLMCLDLRIGHGANGGCNPLESEAPVVIFAEGRSVDGNFAFGTLSRDVDRVEVTWGGESDPVEVTPVGLEAGLPVNFFVIDRPDQNPEGRIRVFDASGAELGSAQLGGTG
jgi:hypothetical protein